MTIKTGKYAARPLISQPGKWAAFHKASGNYWAHTVGSEADARAWALKLHGQDLHAQLDAVQKELELSGAVSETDPRGWLA